MHLARLHDGTDERVVDIGRGDARALDRRGRGGDAEIDGTRTGEITAEAAEGGANCADENGTGHAGASGEVGNRSVRQRLEATTRGLTEALPRGTLRAMQGILSNAWWWCRPGRDPVR